MRTVTRNFLLAMGVLAVLLLALGAVPSYLKSGDPYYLTATPTDAVGNDTAANGSVDAVNASALSAQRYPYTTEALDNATANASGQSTPYWRGPVGLKGAFTHSPFDEYDALDQQFPDAVEGDTVLVRHDGTLYRLAVTQRV
jgi:hypothetical protein